MRSQCQICNGMLEIQQEWVGQKAQCPHCKAEIILQEYPEKTVLQNGGRNPIMRRGWPQPAMENGSFNTASVIKIGVLLIIINAIINAIVSVGEHWLIVVLHRINCFYY